jgi:hypothetical protein
MQTERLIEQLAAGLEPVERLRAPAQRALLWLTLVAVAGAALILGFAHMDAALQRLTIPRIAIESCAIGLTAITAIIAAFQLSVPDRSARWAWLPVPPLLLWLAASGMGCLSHGLILHGTDGLVGYRGDCFMFIVGLSVPLSLLLFAMLRRARPVNPLPVAALGTLGVAASAAFLLEFFHPVDVTVMDLALHLAAVSAVILLGTALRRPLLAVN